MLLIAVNKFRIQSNKQTKDKDKDEEEWLSSEIDMKKKCV